MPALRPGDAATLDIRSHPRHLCLVRAMVRSFAELAGFSERHVDRIALAVDEACSNIMRHAYGGRDDGDVTVTCLVAERPPPAPPAPVLVVRLVDRGCEPPGGCLEVKDRPDPMVPGGLGLRLMHDIMDGVRFSRSPDGCNILELEVALPDGAGPGPGCGEGRP